MIKNTELNELMPVMTVSANGCADQYTVEAIMSLINAKKELLDYPVNLRVDQVSNGLFGKKESCVVIEHRDHLNDFFKICVMVNPITENKFQMMSFQYGFSKNYKRINRIEELKNITVYTSFGLFSQLCGLLYNLGNNIEIKYNENKIDKKALMVEKAFYQEIASFLNCLFD